MQAANKQRGVADKTRKKIILAAKDLFVAHGFAATSISQIARLAKINQSLIYHHFNSKAELWRTVQQALLQNFINEIQSLFIANLPGEMFIEGYVSKRIHAAQEQPGIQRMIQWQRLENTAEQLTGHAREIPSSWVESITKLQQGGQLREDLTPQALIAIMDGTVNGFIESNYFFIANEEALHKSTRILIDMLKAGLSYHSFLVRRGPS